MSGEEQRREVDWRKAMPLIVLVGLLAYANSFDKAFVFDDSFWIQNNLDIASPFRYLRQAPARWVVWLSLALNYWAGGLKVGGYHLVNWGIHVCAALALFGIVRRTLLLECWQGRFERSAPWLALAVALLWVAHPLNTQSVTYVVQRCESLMGLFYLLTLYCVVRGAGSPAGGWWYGLAVVCCALGMGCKEVMFSAPLVVLLYDRVFLASSFRELLRKRWGLHVGLAATWGLLAVEMMMPSTLPGAGNAGFDYQGIPPLQYAMTQAGVILYYVRLAAWPNSLCLDYQDWPVVTRLQDCLIPGLLVLFLLGGTAWALYRQPWLGFLGAWFFLILAPTSSIMPIADVAFEHRMYLPLVALVVLAVLAGDWALRRFVPDGAGRRGLAVGCVVLPVAVLATLTLGRNDDYRSVVSIWTDAVAKRPSLGRGHGALATVHLKLGHFEEAVPHFEEAVRLLPADGLFRTAQAVNWLKTGQLDRAVAALERVTREGPGYASGHDALGLALLLQGKGNRAVECFRRAVEIAPRSAAFRYRLATALFRQGHRKEAETEYEEGLRLDPTFPERTARLAWRLALAAEAERGWTTGEVVFLAEQACGATSFRDPNLLDVLAVACAADGQFDRAAATARAAVGLAEAAGALEQTARIAERARLFEKKKPFQHGWAEQGQ
ncbi:MAG: tetratricopeptide repeat protein [Planctomycetes bacterium]|nr:tetratricopeptide repeat protein [Planctomycetota bacterium]